MVSLLSFAIAMMISSATFVSSPAETSVAEVSATTPQVSQTAQAPGDDFEIVSDVVKDGIRYVSAKTSKLVCSSQIDIQLKGNVIVKCVFTRGCPGNATAVGILVEGMKKADAIKKLKGIPCGNRPTSCPDQLARVLEKL